MVRYVIQCPSCKRKNPIDRETCKYCDAPISRQYVKEAFDQYWESQKITDLKCPVCNNENVQKASLVYEAGTPGLAARCYPPRKESLFTRGKILYVITVPSLLVAFFFLFVEYFNRIPFPAEITFALMRIIILLYILLFVFIVPITYLVKMRRYNKKIPEIYRRWQKAFVCYRCGEVFIPGEAKSIYSSIWFKKTRELSGVRKILYLTGQLFYIVSMSVLWVILAVLGSAWSRDTWFIWFWSHDDR